MTTLLTFDGSLEHDPAIAEWFDARPGDLGNIARHWFSLLRSCGPDVRELLHDGCPVVCVESAPFGYVNAFRRHVNVGFFQGASLPDPSGLLIGSGKFMRHVKLGPEHSPDVTALEALVRAAYVDIKARLSATGHRHSRA